VWVRCIILSVMVRELDWLWNRTSEDFSGFVSELNLIVSGEEGLRSSEAGEAGGRLTGDSEATSFSVHVDRPVKVF
jgi:hypothetical protein